jgi:hypothetical protein
MNGEKNKMSVLDGKLTDEQLGKLSRQFREIERRVNEGTIKFKEAVSVIQRIIIEGKSKAHLQVVNGLAEIKMLDHMIDCDAPPFIHNGWFIEEHGKNGQLGMWKWNPKVGLYISEKQRKGIITGNDLRKELVDRPILNVNVLDYLLAHPKLIPESWKGIKVFFWGTIYRNDNGDLYVRYLYWGGFRWDWVYSWLGNNFDASDSVALAA